MFFSHTVHCTICTSCTVIFTETELRRHSTNFHIHLSVRDLFIPTIDLPILLQEICEPILEIYKLRLRPRNSQKRNTEMGFSLRCSVHHMPSVFVVLFLDFFSFHLLLYLPWCLRKRQIWNVEIENPCLMSTVS